MLASVEGPNEEAASGAQEALYGLNRGEVTLTPRGITVGLECRYMAPSLLTGILPAPITERVLAAKKDGKELKPSEVAEVAEDAKANPEWEKAMRGFVASCVVSINGKPGAITIEDTYQFSEMELGQLLPFCTRQKALPGKA